MKTQRFNFALLHLRTIVASLMLVVALTLIPAAAFAGTVTFSFTDSCQDCDPTSHLWTASTVGQTTMESGVTITNVSAGGSPLALTAGRLVFTSAPATSAFYDPFFTWNASYANQGGGTRAGTPSSITDTSFGNDLTISFFLGDGSSAQWTKPYGYDQFESSYIGDINPAILSALGLDPRFAHGVGTITDSLFGDASLQTWNSTVTVTFTPSPEPGTLALFGSGIVGLVGLLRRKIMG